MSKCSHAKDGLPCPYYPLRSARDFWVNSTMVQCPHGTAHNEIRVVRVTEASKVPVTHDGNYPTVGYAVEYDYYTREVWSNGKCSWRKL